MTTIEKLRLFKAEFEKVQEFGYNLPLGLFVFIQNNEILKEKFDYRLHYFKNLATDKEFLEIQDQLCEKTIAILRFISIESVNEIQEKLNYKYKNYFKSEQTEITLPELYQLGLNKSNYYQLDENTSQDYAGISYQVKKQFEQITRLLNLVGYYVLSENLNFDFYESIGEYNKVFIKFNQKIEWLPTALGIKAFTDFTMFCASLAAPEEFKSNIRINDFKGIKKVCETVIDKLINSIGDYKELDIPDLFWTEKTTIHSIIDDINKGQLKKENFDEYISELVERIMAGNSSTIQGIKSGNMQKAGDWLVFHTKNGVELKFSGLTGDFIYGQVEGNFAPGTQEHIVFSLLLQAPSHIVKYQTLIEASKLDVEMDVSFKGKFQPSLVMPLSQIIKQIKIGLKILPREKSLNEDIFKSQRKIFSYRLLLKD